MKKQNNIYPIPAPIVFTARILEKIAPSAAAAFSRFFFKRPLKHSLRPEEKIWRDKAQQNELFIDSINKKIITYKWGDAGPKVLVVHGWSGHGTSLWKLIEKLLDEGFEVYSFDAPAHGQSPTSSTLMLEFIESIKAMDKTFGPFEAVVGHSMGGISALNAVGSHGLKTKKLVTVGIPDSIKKIFYQFAEVMGLGPGIAEKNIEYLSKVYGMDIDKISGSYNARLTHIPVLVVHDKNDKEVPHTEALSIIEQLPHGKLLLTEGLGHRRIIRDPQILQHIVEFIKET